MIVWFKDKKKTFFWSNNITRYEKAGCLITLVPKVNISSKIEIHSPTPDTPGSLWCVGVWVLHQTSGSKPEKASQFTDRHQRERLPHAQVGPRESVLQLHNLLICQIWMEQTARTALLKQVHCCVRYTHRFTSKSANSRSHEACVG